MKSINTTNAAAANAALNLKVNHQTRTIEMNKTFADKASRFGSDEYDAQMLAREQNPGYTMKVITRKTTKSDKPSYKGLTYEYMEKYILAHDDENQKIMNEYLELRAMTDEAEDALLESATYQEMKDWFLDKFPAIADFHQKREELLAKAQSKKETKRQSEAREKLLARRAALLGKKTA